MRSTKETGRARSEGATRLWSAGLALRGGELRREAQRNVHVGALELGALRDGAAHLPACCRVRSRLRSERSGHSLDSDIALGLPLSPFRLRPAFIDTRLDVFTSQIVVQTVAVAVVGVGAGVAIAVVAAVICSMQYLALASSVL